MPAAPDTSSAIASVAARSSKRYEGLRPLLLPQCFHGWWKRKRRPWGRRLSVWKREGIWLRGQDLNLRPSGYEPDELPGCSTPRKGRCMSLRRLGTGGLSGRRVGRRVRQSASDTPLLGGRADAGPMADVSPPWSRGIGCWLGVPALGDLAATYSPTS